jgi:MinD superfamily P-loop ATPase
MKIAVASGKGGTGKTTVSVNLAHMISCNNGNEVVLADLDVEEPDSGFFIKGDLQSLENIYRDIPEWDKERCTACNQCSTLCRFNAIVRLPGQTLVFPELCHSCYVCADLCPGQALKMIRYKTGVLAYYKSGRVNLVESRLEIGEPSAVPLIRQTKEWLNNRFSGSEIFILDCPPGNSCSFIEAVENTDFVILVTEPTPFGLHDLKIAVETIKQLKLFFGVVLNKYGTGNKDVEIYCESNNIPLLGKIPYQRVIAEAYSKGELLYNDYFKFRSELIHIYKYLTSLVSQPYKTNCKQQT